MRRGNPPAPINKLQNEANNTSHAITRIQLDLIGGINSYMPNMAAHTRKAEMQDEQIRMLTRCHTIAEINSIRNKFTKYGRDSNTSPRKKGFPPIVSNAGPYSTSMRFNEYTSSPRINRQRDKIRTIQDEMENMKHISNTGSKLSFKRLEGYELRGSKISNAERSFDDVNENAGNHLRTPSGDKQGTIFPSPTAMRKAIENFKDKKLLKSYEEKHVRHIDKESKSTAIAAYIKRQINQKRALQHPSYTEIHNKKQIQTDRSNKNCKNITKSGSNLNGVRAYVVKDHSQNILSIPANTTFNLTTKNLEIYDFITNPKRHEDEDDDEDEDDENRVDERVVAWVMDRQIDPTDLKNIPEECDPELMTSLVTPLTSNEDQDGDHANGDTDFDNTVYSQSRETTSS